MAAHCESERAAAQQVPRGQQVAERIAGSRVRAAGGRSASRQAGPRTRQEEIVGRPVEVAKQVGSKARSATSALLQKAFDYFTRE